MSVTLSNQGLTLVSLLRKVWSPIIGGPIDTQDSEMPRRPDEPLLTHVDPSLDGKRGTVTFEKTNGRVRKESGLLVVVDGGSTLRVVNEQTGYFRAIPAQFVLRVQLTHQ